MDNDNPFEGIPFFGDFEKLFARNQFCTSQAHFNRMGTGQNYRWVTATDGLPSCRRGSTFAISSERGDRTSNGRTLMLQ